MMRVLSGFEGWTWESLGHCVGVLEGFWMGMRKAYFISFIGMIFWLIGSEWF